MHEIAFIRCRGDKNVAQAIGDMNEKGWDLFQIVWTGNLEAKQPGILQASGDPTKISMIHLYMVVFRRPVKEIPVNPDHELGIVQ
jgi:hypothetical protein